jgi:gluconate 2-dehydrogenase gamma chain
MAGQSVERREILRVMAIAAAASQFPGFCKWAYGCGHAEQITAVRPASYQPQFFSDHEYKTVERLADLIIPSDGSPGAKDVGVAEFIDFMACSDEELQYPLRTGIAWLDAHARGLHGEEFIALAPPRQTEILQHLAYKDKFRAGEEDGRLFFRQIREQTVMGFYTTRAGLEELDCPELRFYTESPGCPHHGNPEHRNLAAES